MVRYLVGVVASLCSLFLAWGCNGRADGIRFVADEEATVSFARENQYKYCNIRTDMFCQSPDSVVMFEMPLQLNAGSGSETQINSGIRIVNVSDQPISLKEYYITLSDDIGTFYRADFQGPNEYTNTAARDTALTLAPAQKAEVSFQVLISPRAESVRSISVFYRLIDQTELTRVVVSYRPPSLFDAWEYEKN